MRIGSDTHWLGHKPRISPLVDHFHSDSIDVRVLDCRQNPVQRFRLGMAQRLDPWR